MRSEDFADMFRPVPGTDCWLGHNGDVPLHYLGFILDDTILATGASLFARLVEKTSACFVITAESCRVVIV
jgi:hypothetical protein